MKNTDLKQKYDEMHKQGQTAWFDDGQAEREAILEMGKPWEGKIVLEIGCGEGDLVDMIEKNGGQSIGIDYSKEAIEKAEAKYGPVNQEFYCVDWRDYEYINHEGKEKFNVLVLQGVLEHLDNPFQELSEMIKQFNPDTVVMSMPCFINLRGIVWQTLHMAGAVMSKTDLHYIDPDEVRKFCILRGYRLKRQSIDWPWACGEKMMDDFEIRIPLALKDAGIKLDKEKFDKFLTWLFRLPFQLDLEAGEGAISIYRIDI